VKSCADCSGSIQDATIKGFLPSNDALQAPSNGQVLPLGSPAQRGVPDVCSSSADAHCSTVHALAMCRVYLCSAGGDAMIRVWDAATLKLHRWGTLPSTCQNPSDPTRRYIWPLSTYSKSGSKFCCPGKPPRQSSASSRVLSRAVLGHGFRITDTLPCMRAIGFYRPDRCMAFCRVLRGHRGSVLTLYSSASLLFSGGRDNVIRVWVSTASVS